MCSSANTRATVRPTTSRARPSKDLKRTQPWKARPFAPQSVTDPRRAEEVTARGAIPDIDVSCRWSYRSRSHEASFVNRHRPGRNPCNFFFLNRRGGSQVRLRAGSQGYAGEGYRRLEDRQGEGPRDLQ